MVKQEQDGFFTSADKDRMLTEMYGQLRAGFAKYNILSGEGDATAEWLRNMGVDAHAGPASVIGKWEAVEPTDRELLLGDYAAIAGGSCGRVQREVRVRGEGAWKRVLFGMEALEFSPEKGSVIIASSAYDITAYDASKSHHPRVPQRIISPHEEAVLGSLSSALIYINSDYEVQWSTIQSLEKLGNIPAGSKYRVGDRCFASVFGREEPCVKCSFREMLKTGERHVGQYEDEGTIIEISANPVFNDQRRLIGGLLQLEDTTSRTMQQRRIKELNRTMEAILEYTPVCIFVKNPNDSYRYIYWNKAMAEYTKIPEERVLGRTDWEVFPRAEDADKFHKDDLYLLETGESIEFQEEYVDAQGCRRVVNTLKTIIPVDEELPWLLGVSWDITDLKNTEAQLIEAKEKAEESDKFKSMFLANMSHEIRTPLHAIVGFAELFTEDSLSREDKQEYMSIIKTNTNLLLQLISDILDLSRIEAQDLDYTYRDVDINNVCSRISMTSTMQNKCAVPIIFDESLPHYIVRCDENRVQQIVTNFVNNAIKFTHTGSITISYRLLGDSEIEISVTDTGIGIPEDKVVEVFDRFTKLNSFAQGTGLGLAICKNLVEQMHGRIGVESTEGKGSRFWFTLPYDKKLVCETF